MRSSHQINLRVAERAQKSLQPGCSGGKTEIHLARLWPVGVPDAKQIYRIDIPVLGEEIEIVPPAKAVSHEAVDKHHRRQLAPGSGRQVEIAHAILPTAIPELPILPKAVRFLQYRLHIYFPRPDLSNRMAHRGIVVGVIAYVDSIGESLKLPLF
jgi:hypothetical protein